MNMNMAYWNSKLEEMEDRVFGHPMQSLRDRKAKLELIWDDVLHTVLKGKVEDFGELVSILLDRERLVDINRD